MDYGVERDLRIQISEKTSRLKDQYPINVRGPYDPTTMIGHQGR